MLDYIGEECIVCKEKFKNGDDIVVCPDCGTPYHRECYAQNGKCINISLHGGSKSWNDIINEKKAEEKKNTNASENAQNNQSAEENIYCKYCGSIVSKNSNFCPKCGKNTSFDNGRIKYPNSSAFIDIGGKQVKVDFNDQYAGLDPEEDFDGVKVKNVAEFIGSNRFMLLVLFKKFCSKASKVSTNIACLFFPYLYFAYRKMWKYSFAVIAIISLLSIPSFLSDIVSIDLAQYKESLTDALQTLPSYADQFIQIMYKWQDMLKPYSALINNLSVISSALIMALRIILFLFGNYIYFKYAAKKVKNIQDNNPSQLCPAKCAEEGGTSVLNVIISLVIKIAASFFVSLIVIVLLLLNTK